MIETAVLSLPFFFFSLSLGAQRSQDSRYSAIRGGVGSKGRLVICSNVPGSGGLARDRQQMSYAFSGEGHEIPVGRGNHTQSGLY